MLIGPIFGLLALIGLLAIFIWLVRLFVWLVGMARGYERARASRFRRSRQPIDVLEERLVTGEIDAAEFEEKRSLLLTDTGLAASAIVDRRNEMASGHAE